MNGNNLIDDIFIYQNIVVPLQMQLHQFSNSFKQASYKMSEYVFW